MNTQRFISFVENDTAARKVLMLLFGAALVQAMVCRVLLPPTVASHFDVHGAPDGWMDRDAYLFLQALTIGITGLVLLLIIRVLRHVPESMLNLPNKPFWLAPARRERTLRRLEGWIGWMSSLTVAFLMGVFHHVCLRNLYPGTGDTAFWIMFVGFVVLLLLLVVAMLLRFSRPGEDGGRPYDVIE